MLKTAEVKGLLGLLLVDGSLNDYRTAAGGYVQLTLTGGIFDSAYLEDKVEEFRQFIPTKAEIVPYRNVGGTTSRSNRQGVVTGKAKTTPVLRFRVSTEKLRPIYNLLYPHGVRCITEEVLEMLGAAAAAWVWAEGARTPTKGKARFDGTTILARVGTTDDEALLISAWLELLTGATSTLISDEDFSDEDADDEGESKPKRNPYGTWKKPRLVFTPEQAAKAKKALRSYAPPSRLHVFQPPNEDLDAETDQDGIGLVPGQGDHEHPRSSKEAMA